jgi:hypothetical protein
MSDECASSCPVQELLVLELLIAKVFQVQESFYIYVKKSNQIHLRYFTELFKQVYAHI